MMGTSTTTEWEVRLFSKMFGDQISVELWSDGAGTPYMRAFGYKRRAESENAPTYTHHIPQMESRTVVRVGGIEGHWQEVLAPEYVHWKQMVLEAL